MIALVVFPAAGPQWAVEAPEPVAVWDEPTAGVIQLVFARATTAGERLETVALFGFPIRINAIGPVGEVGVAEAPGPHNGWHAAVLRLRTSRETIVNIMWSRIHDSTEVIP